MWDGEHGYRSKPLPPWDEQRDAAGIIGIGLRLLNSICVDVLVHKLSITTSDSRSLEHPVWSSQLVSDTLPQWEKSGKNTSNRL